MSRFTADVIVIGSGAGGAAVAGELGRRGMTVKVLEAGSIATTAAGTHSRNERPMDASMPEAVEYLSRNYVAFNGDAQAQSGLPGLGAIRAVGGLFTAWSNNAPTHDVSELPEWLDLAEWNPLVARAQRLLHVSQEVPDSDPRSESLRDGFRRAVGSLPEGREVQNMPIAAVWDGKQLHFSGADDLLVGAGAAVEIVTNRIVRRIVTDGDRAVAVEAYASATNEVETFSADHIVVATGTVGSAQLVAASRLDAGEALGAYLTEHVIFGSRISLKPEFRVDHEVDGPTFALWAPASAAHPWQTQLTRHILGYTDELPPNVDPRNTADILGLCPIEPRPENRLRFDFQHLDDRGLPTADGSISFSRRDREIAARALGEQFLVADELGELEWGWGSSLVPRGGTTHLMGSCRMGPSDDGTSVVSPTGRLWQYTNIHVAGNAVLGAANAGNPTLTAVAHALHAADAIAGVGTEFITAAAPISTSGK
ncbi:choline dehydrogenase-like flavoprotein [Microbacterium sp. BE35]|uniref:FAD-dependent oxidoreductase n=1 Tax=Microbacterium sp. BE35 TaxID=2817773 RepID=UPI00285731A3|nr:FAD-dependent oxidoreductase [Microbacterium sp. BE35]MDR7188231.1 choline dehydrogenase-like flavoprotein [Microbacterium sp. BE35]